MFFKHISLPVFLVSLAIGLFIVYIYGADVKTIYVYPTPENVNQILFKDKSNTCFAYQPKEVKCTSDAKLIPVQ